MIKYYLSTALTFSLALASGTAVAQSVIGYGPSMVIPVVAQTSTYTSEVFIGHQSGVPLTVAVTYVGAIGSASPGLRDCGTVAVPGGIAGTSSASFSLGAQCGLPSGSHFGMLFLENSTSFGSRGFFAYSRVQNSRAIGFSVEGFTIGSLSPQSQRVFGLKRASDTGGGSVPIQTNCFVGSFDKPVNYLISLYDSNGAGLGSVGGSLAPFQLVRYLDIFGAAGVLGDHTNASAIIRNTDTFTDGNTNFPPYISFCTVQDNISFGADFRIAKAYTAFDGTYSQQIFGCEPLTCGSYDYFIADVSKKDVIAMFVRAPDQISCELKSDRLGDLELQLRQPDILPVPLSSSTPGSSVPWGTPGPVVAGGNNQIAFAYDTGFEIVRQIDGTIMRDFWSLEISARESVSPSATPIPYSISCTNRSGTIFARPYSADDDF